MRLCIIEGCDKEVRSCGYCAAHYSKLLRYGDPLGGRKAPDELFWAKVQKSEGCWLWTGTADRQGYGHFKSRGENHMAHRYAYERLVGPIEPGLVLDHFICFNHRCVNPSHVRKVTQAQNSQNRSGAPRNSTTGVRGVHQLPTGKFTAKFEVDGTVHYLGRFASLAEAENAVSTARNEHMPFSEMDRR